MKIAISQPEHFPYLGYFQKMSSADLFVILDDVRFSGPRSFQNRNRFSMPPDKSEWFTVPVCKGSYFQALNKVNVAPDLGWRRKLLRKLQCRFHLDLSQVYDSENLCTINLRSIDYLRQRLGISVPMVKSSELGVSGTKSELLSNICSAVQGSVYICGTGGRAYLDETAFASKGIIVEYHSPQVSHHFTALETI